MSKFIFGKDSRFDRALVDAGIVAKADEEFTSHVVIDLKVGEPAFVQIHKFLDMDQADALADALVASRTEAEAA